MSNPNLDNNSHLDPTETQPTAPMDLDTARRVEQEKLTRRAALRKLGFGAGIAAFSMLGVDDLARMVGKRMERMAGDSKVAGQIAKEFQSAGIALASPSGTGSNLPDNCVDNQTADNTACCDGTNVGDWCYNRYTTTAERSECCSGTYRNLCSRYTGGGNLTNCHNAAG